ncbi:MAG: BrnA antitoxin family protein [Amaricoccus sp.]|uniref:BrnA antitoxin family protein n=1 Tax=Amaricoccus sp. TaxID=1872485 RepID=UPI0039E6F5D8
MAERRRSKTEERAYAELQERLRELNAIRLEMTTAFERLKFDNLPPAWGGIEDAVPVRPKRVRITALYDEDVARFFRGMGQGYQARMNAVLRAYMLAIVSRAIKSKRHEDWMGREI